MLYVHACNACLWLFGLIPPPSPQVSDVAYVRGVAEQGAEAGVEGGGQGLTAKGLPLIKPPYGTITAINLDKGDIVWEVAHGDTPDAIRNSPLLKGLNIPRTGIWPTNLGTLVTKTLVIAGYSSFTTTASLPRGALLSRLRQGHRRKRRWFILAPQTGSPMT